MPLIDVLTPLALFMALVLAASLHGLAASGHFPRGQRKSTLASGFGSVLLFGSIALVVVCFVAGIAAAARFIPWYAAIIGGGFSLLAAPLVLRWFPDRFVDGRGAPVAFAGASAALALLMMWLVVGARCDASADAPSPLQIDKTNVLSLSQAHGKCPGR